METKKHPLASKTLWANLLMSIFGFALAYKPELSNVLNEGNVLMLMGVVNMILRAVTKDKLAIE